MLIREGIYLLFALLMLLVLSTTITRLAAVYKWDGRLPVIMDSKSIPVMDLK